MNIKETTQAVNIICMKWGNKYGAEYVNKLYKMISRNLNRSFKLTCFTDDSSNILPSINIKPLPFLDLPKNIPERGWNKLSTLQDGLGGLEGDVLFLDLDVVIIDSIDELFDHPAEFLIIQDVKLKSKLIGNSSVYRFRVGEHQNILDKFINNFEVVKNTHRNEQAYLSTEINNKGLLNFWPTEWCPSFKYHCMQPWPINYFKDASIPDGAKIIIFHGHPEPHEAIEGVTQKWYRYVRPTHWIKNYWCE